MGKAGDGVRRSARAFMALCVAACVVAALLSGALLSARHGAHRFYCPDEHCEICFTVEAQLSLTHSWGMLALGLAMLAFAVLALREIAGILAETKRSFTLFALGVRLNS
jgi:hypothetical protein